MPSLLHAAIFTDVVGHLTALEIVREKIMNSTKAQDLDIGNRSVEQENLMKAVEYDKYGPPDVLHFREVEKPTPKDNEVLIKVHASSANAADWRLLRADPFLVRLMGLGFFKPKNKILGMDIAGRVGAVGRNAKQFQPGDEVFGDIFESGLGGFAEYVCVS